MPSRAFTFLLLLGPSSLLAQREPVLKQINVPHNYYYREMYLPQVTSGPNAVAWSPDGNELVYSMQGTLWRQRIGSKEARQITSGPGYHHQPDWSPDGRFIVYATYVSDAIELRILELATGESRTIVANGAVNVEPRWSPDGGRLAFVSTVHNARWHIHVAQMNNGEALEIERLTDDNDSGLPRYYYSRFDHFLSPTWSPDGSEMIYVSNRNHIWGSGGFWRMSTRSGGKVSSREIRYEETTWRGRPDWSPDGKRVVYSSYQGRQWHQLWLMTADGGDPFPITYGDFDATAARWSRDGGKIAYISNEGGNTSLWTLELPGGRRRKVDIGKRIYRQSMGRLRITVVDGATGRPVAARVSITSVDGRSFAPDDAWRHADDSFDRKERPFEYSYFHSPGISEVTVPAGGIRIEALKGLEYRPVTKTVAVRPDSSHAVRIALNRLINLPARGWYSGDLHIHMNYGGAYRNTPENLAFQAEAEDLHVVENLIVNKEQRVPDIAYFSTVPDAVSKPGLIIAHGQEYHTSFWGHSGLLGLGSHFLLPDYAGYVNTAAASLEPTNSTVFDLAHEQGAVTGYVHPFDTEPDPSRKDEALTHALPVDVAFGKVDYLEVVGFSDHLLTAKVWYRLLNCGFRIAAGAGTDAMANFASLRGPVGMSRVFVKLDQPLTHHRWLAGLRAGRTFATNGPLLGLTIAGQEPGAEIRLPGGKHDLPVRATLQSIVPVDHLELVMNGEVVETFPISGDRLSATISRTVQVEKSGWLTLRAWSERATHPVLDLYPFATTSPIYVAVAGAPVRSARDAEYFLAWIDRIRASVSAHTGWNTPSEREEVMRLLSRARHVYQERSKP